MNVIAHTLFGFLFYCEYARDFFTLVDQITELESIDGTSIEIPRKQIHFSFANVEFESKIMLHSSLTNLNSTYDTRMSSQSAFTMCPFSLMSLEIVLFPNFS